MWFRLVLTIICFGVAIDGFYYRPTTGGSKTSEMKQRCPKVKAMRNFNLTSILGSWYVMQYYASSEEVSEYSCMRSVFSMHEEHVTMFFTYIYEDDPQKEQLQGNIIWTIPNFSMPSHWVHTEDIYEGIYNTYIIDTDSKAWALIMHCAEKSRSPRYLSALLLSREKIIGTNVVNFLREKLPRYDIDLSQMFPIQQDECEKGVSATMQRVVESTQLPVAADDGPRMPSEDDARYVVPRDEELSAKEIYDDFF